MLPLQIFYKRIFIEVEIKKTCYEYISNNRNFNNAFWNIPTLLDQ